MILQDLLFQEVAVDLVRIPLNNAKAGDIQNTIAQLRGSASGQ